MNYYAIRTRENNAIISNVTELIQEASFITGLSYALLNDYLKSIINADDIIVVESDEELLSLFPRVKEIKPITKRRKEALFGE